LAVMLARDFIAVLRHFCIDGTFVDATSHGSGHINHSYRVSFDEGGSTRRFLLQRLNTGIFKQPELLMDNMQRVTSHLAARLVSQPDAERRVLTLVPTHEGQTWHRDAGGSIWRVFVFIENALSYDSIALPNQAFEAAKAFGSFQQALADLPAPRLHETIPAFHDTPKRFRDFEESAATDIAHRALLAGAEIGFAFSRRSITSVLLDAKLPERVTHNDTKLNNVMFDATSGEALCVVDLDTVMPGLALYDFGDMVRTATSSTAEDEEDLSRVAMQFPLFAALARGYLTSASGFLTHVEKALLPTCGKVIAFEQGIRFLNDYLRGDIYYKVTRTGQNLDRCRTQFKLVESIEQQEGEMEQLVRLL
jgi:Ser/Thr protein kinase RdoA (MazF antagonist)